MINVSTLSKLRLVPRQDAPAQAGLHLAHGIHFHAGGRVEDETQRGSLQTDLHVALARRFLKHPIDHADVEGHSSLIGEPGWVAARFA